MNTDYLEKNWSAIWSAKWVIATLTIAAFLLGWKVTDYIYNERIKTFEIKLQNKEFPAPVEVIKTVTDPAAAKTISELQSRVKTLEDELRRQPPATASVPKSSQNSPAPGTAAKPASSSKQQDNDASRAVKQEQKLNSASKPADDTSTITAVSNSQLDALSAAMAGTSGTVTFRWQNNCSSCEDTYRALKARFQVEGWQVYQTSVPKSLLTLGGAWSFSGTATFTLRCGTLQATEKKKLINIFTTAKFDLDVADGEFSQASCEIEISR